ncbi:MAG: dTMP kinase, partial [Erythrobacter sp.]
MAARLQGPRGRFIALEGGEGTGKSTQTRLLADALTARGIEVETTREPGGTPGAEAIRDLLLAPPGEGWAVEAEALLFAAARADHVARLIRPSLDAGRWVVCDRFVDSSRAYQGGAGRLGDEAIRALHAFGSAGLRPDLTVLLDVGEAQVVRRLAARDGEASDAIGGRGEDYHRAVA